MEIKISDFINKLMDIYNADPSGYAPFAYWKIRDLCEDARAFWLPEFDCYYMIRDRHLLVYYSPDNKNHIPISELNSLDCISMKASVFNTIKDQLTGFNVNYFDCLFYDKKHEPLQASDSTYYASNFDFSEEEHYRLAAGIIDEHEGSGFFSADNIKKMTGFSAFAPELWFFVRERSTDEPVGICITAYEPEVSEADLDWIYIRTKYQGRGAGRFMIEEIVRRTVDHSKVIRVGGTVGFYKRCGFYTREVNVWAAKPGYTFYAPRIQPNVLT